MTALYRRYRPDTFQDVIGQAHVTEPLKHALAASRAHHAYLFSGPRGCGKTTSARILARCLNCAEGPTDTPCGSCPSCVELSREGGGSLDVVEIDAASHNGVDDARELRERAVFAPARDRYKIFILDEAHMVTQQGFNALLKIVEEPPEHVKFIFATTEPEKVLTTIRSRTHHYPFRLVPPGELLAYLENIASSESMSVEQGVLALVVQAGGGSVRDSLSLLDQLISGTEGGNVSLASAQALLGYTPRSVLNDLLEALAENDSHTVFHILSQSVESGNDPRRFVEDLLGHIRDVIVIQATGDSSGDLFPGVSAGDLDTWKEQAQWFEPQTLSEMADVIAHSLAEMSGVTSPRLQLELLAARLLPMISAGRPRTFIDHSQPVATTIESQPGQLNSGVPPESPAQGTPLNDRATAAESAEPSEVEPVEPWDISVLEGMWHQIIENLAQQKRSLWVALSSTRPLSIHEDVLTIGFIKRADADILKKPQGPGSPLPNADLLRDSILRFTGHRLRFTVGELGQESKENAKENARDTSWPEVSGTQIGDSEQMAVDSDSAAASEAHSSDSSKTEDGSAQTASIATRGEPVVRQLLGGELVAEELLDSMANQGESDV